MGIISEVKQDLRVSFICLDRSTKHKLGSSTSLRAGFADLDKISKPRLPVIAMKELPQNRFPDVTEKEITDVFLKADHDCDRDGLVGYGELVDLVQQGRMHSGTPQHSVRGGLSERPQSRSSSCSRIGKLLAVPRVQLADDKAASPKRRRRDHERPLSQGASLVIRNPDGYALRRRPCLDGFSPAY